MIRRHLFHSIPPCIIFLTGLAFLITGVDAVTLGQDPATRHELGWRLRRFESELEKDMSDDKLRRAVRPMTRAVDSFFSQNWENANDQLGEAYVQVADFENKAIAREAAALTVKLEKVVVPDSIESFRLTLFQHTDLYSAVEFSDDFRKGELTARLLNSDGETVVAVRDESFNGEIIFELEDEVPAGDYQLEVDYAYAAIDGVDAQIVRLARRTVSIVERLNERIDETQDRLTQLEQDGADAGAILTAKGYIRLIERLMRGAPSETDFSSNRYLRLSETIADRIQEGESNWLGNSPSGEFRLKLVNNDAKATVRVHVPEVTGGTRLPVVVALHGAGGSENFFFDGYGDGKIVNLCKERDWIIVSPRLTFNGTGLDLDEMLDELGDLFPVDRSKVMLVGHSMGAMNILAQVNSTTTPYRAAAIMGGGFMIPESERTAAVPMFIATGQYDFAASGGRALADSMKEYGYEHEFREYPFVEHMTIVQVSLSDAFEYFDQRVGASDE